MRAVGTIAALGGLAYAVAGIRLLVLGIAEDTLTDALGVVWAVSWVAGGWALLRLRVTGTGWPGRAVSSLLVLGFLLAAAWGAYRLVDRVAADSSPVAAAPMVVILGMLGTGVLAPRAGSWSGWSRFVPLGIAAVYVATVAVSVRTGAYTLGYAFSLAGAGYVALGLAIRASPDPQPAAEVAPAAPAA